MTNKFIFKSEVVFCVPGFYVQFLFVPQLSRTISTFRSLVHVSTVFCKGCFLNCPKCQYLRSICQLVTQSLCSYCTVFVPGNSVELSTGRQHLTLLLLATVLYSQTSTHITRYSTKHDRKQIRYQLQHEKQSPVELQRARHMSKTPVTFVKNNLTQTTTIKEWLLLTL